MQALDMRATTAEASASEGALRLKTEVQNRRRLEDELTNVKLARARAARDGEAASLRESTANEKLRDLELRLGLREEEIRVLKGDVARVQSMLALEKEVVGSLKPLEGTLVARAAEIEALKMKVGFAPSKKVVQDVLGSARWAVHCLAKRWQFQMHA
jgi:hypothetical protein